MKTIGVLGGIGPQATMDFEARVHRVSQRLIPPSINGGYPPMVVYYCRHAPFLLKHGGTPQIPLRLDPRLLEAAKRLGSLADFLVITANGPHLFLPEIEQAAGCRVLSMVEATLKEVYTRPLGQLGIVCETADGAARDALDSAVFQVMEGRDDVTSLAVAQAAVADLRARGVDGVILGCTEIPLLLRDTADEADLINPAQLLAEAAVRVALREPEWIS